MQQRKKQPHATRQALLDAAGEEFSRVGYAASGLSGIVARAGLTKGALFHHFPDKRGLARGWIEERLAKAMAELWSQPLESAATLDALRNLCRLRINELEAGDATCALSALAAEITAQDDLLGTSLDQIFDAWRSAIASFLERGKAAGRIHHSIKPAAEAAFLVSVIAGVSVTAKSSRSGDSRRACLHAVEDYLETLRSQQS
jgi:AcrR family transcriptional regulator